MIDWLFRDRTTGKLVIAQFPNVPLWIFFVGTALRLLLDPGGAPGDVLRAVTTAALVWWGVDEVLRGVNPWRRFLGGVVLLGQLVALGAAATGVPVRAAPDQLASVDVAASWFGATPPLAPDQIEVAVTSSLPATVTGGDARIELRGVQSDDVVRVERNGDDTTASLRPTGSDVLGGVIDGLRVGTNDVTATVSGPAGKRRATLRLTNHPITGPVISGPHQEPFVCETEAAGLGKPLDDDCSAGPRSDWFARSAITGRFSRLDDPGAPYPPDTATTTTSEGRTVPFVVRVDSLTVNRSITRIAVLDDPHENGSAWNRRLLYSFGQSCGTGHHQGVNLPDNALGQISSGGNPYDNAFAPFVDLPTQLGTGAMTVHSTLTILGVDCNDVISAETLMMIKEHVIEAYGPLEHTIGVGASGGGIQQYTAANNYPGLIDVGTPMISFPDMTTTLMTVGDCLLLDRVFDADPLRWIEPKRVAVTGHRTANICRDWDASYASLLRPDACDPAVPDGVRCTFQDDQVNLWGRDSTTGFARRPLDNTGVQYGLAALRDGLITIDDFVTLNAAVGGLDIDGIPTPVRMAMDAEVAHIAYETGRVTGRGALAQTPIIDNHQYLDLLPMVDVHDDARALMARARLDAHLGGHGGQAVWLGAPYPSDSFGPAAEWSTALEARGGASDDESRAAAVAASRPPSARDRCTLPFGVGVDGTAPCDSLAAGSPRIAAGGPPTEDVIKCALAPIDPTAYPGITPGQLETLQQAFPGGVCDWSAQGVGETARSTPWLSFGDGTRPPAPLALANVVARSAPTADAAPAGRPASGGALPATGAQPWTAAGAAVLATALVVRAYGRGRDAR